MADFVLAPYNSTGPRAVGFVECEVGDSIDIEAPVECVPDPTDVYPNVEVVVTPTNEFASAWHIANFGLNGLGYPIFELVNDTAGQPGDIGTFRVTVTRRI